MELLKHVLMEGLSYFHLIAGNWALAIVLLAVGVRFLLLPFQIFNHLQQSKLRLIQPEIDRISKTYKTEPLRAYQEIQKLKKQNGVRTWTPLILSLVQIPIFISMYRTISGAKTLAGASFAWIPSLATPDALYILPILVALTTYLQFKNKDLDSGNPEAKAMMSKVMPVMNFILMAALPSSLVLYYAVSGIFQLLSDSALKHWSA